MCHFEFDFMSTCFERTFVPACCVSQGTGLGVAEQSNTCWRSSCKLDVNCRAVLVKEAVEKLTEILCSPLITHCPGVDQQVRVTMGCWFKVPHWAQE